MAFTTCTSRSGGEVGKLNKFINYFSPATQIDGALIKAMILTLFSEQPPASGRIPGSHAQTRTIEQGRSIGRIRRSAIS